LTTYFDDQVKSWASANDDYQRNLSEYQRKNSFVVMASKPLQPISPEWPKPWLIMMVTGLSMLALSCIYFIFIDHIKEAYAEITQE
jgi:uncharacterized protein involved in exopolysaccharide biosynthesis